MLDAYESEEYTTIFADGVAKIGIPNTGMVVLVDGTDDTGFGWPYAVVVHNAITHLSAKEARRLRDALTEVLDG
jgi:hypothetical protein